MQTQRFAKKLYFYRNLFQKSVDKNEAIYSFDNMPILS